MDIMCGLRARLEGSKLKGYPIFRSGITVDIHLSRIFCALGWADAFTNNGKGYDSVKVMRQLMSWWPREQWPELNELYAGLGQLLRNSKSRYAAAQRLIEIGREQGDDVVECLERLLNAYE